MRCKQSIDDPFRDESGKPRQNKSWKADRRQWAKAAPAERNDRTGVPLSCACQESDRSICESKRVFWVTTWITWALMCNGIHGGSKWKASIHPLDPQARYASDDRFQRRRLLGVVWTMARRTSQKVKPGNHLAALRTQYTKCSSKWHAESRMASTALGLANLSAQCVE